MTVLDAELLEFINSATVSKQIRIKGGPGSGHHGHKGIPGHRGGSLPGSGRAWTGEQVPRAKDGSRISKLRTGELGEMYAKQALAEKFGVPFVELNQGMNNAPIDIAGDHHAVEVKAGLNTNGKTAQHWRATIGQPGKEERKLISKMTSKEKRQHNIRKEQAILERKNSMLEEMSEAAGAEIKPATIGIIMAEDGSRADVYFVPGFHLRLTWQEYATDEHYLGTYDMDTVQKGGPGSGHHGHQGRPGKRGGSLPGSGIAGSTDISIIVSADKYPPGTKVIDIQERQPNGSPIRGQEVISPDDPRIGDEVYHMTTNMSGVRESGELSARGAGGLGGDAADQIVSMTVDKGIAEQLTSDMRFTVQTARDFYEGEPKPKWNGTEWKVYDRNGNEYDPMPWANKLVSRLHQRSLEEGWSFGGPEGRPDVQMRQYQIGDWMRQYFMQRDFQANINNPFIFTDAEQLRHLNPNNIGIVSIPRNNLRTGALLVNFDLGKRHLEEIRLYGDVPLSGATISKETNIRIRQV